MEWKIVVQLITRTVLFVYLTFIIYFLLGSFLSDLYLGSLIASVIQWLWNCLGLIVVGLTLIFLILHVTHILRIERKVFLSLLGLFLVHLFVGYLEIRKNGW